VSIKVINLTAADFVGGSAGTWSALNSTDGMVRIYNQGPCVLHVNEASSTEDLTSNPATVGIFLQPGESVTVPSDDGTSETRIGMYILADSLINFSSQVVSIISNGG